MAEDLTGKWSYSLDGLSYGPTFGTKEEAIAECRQACRNPTGGWVGQCRMPASPESYISTGFVNDLIERILDGEEDYSMECADGWPGDSEAQRLELAELFRTVFRGWLERHGLMPKWFVIDYVTVEEVKPEEPADG